MGVDKDIIVAIELGSSTIRGIAGQKEADGSLKILAIEQENTKDCIRRGVVHNLDKTTSTIRRIKDRLNEKLNVSIKRAYVGISGQSLHTISNKISKDLGGIIKITTQHTDCLQDENSSASYPKREILQPITQEYVVNGEKTTEPEGIQGSRLEGHFLNIIARTTLRENIEKCMHEAGLDIAELLISPIEEAKCLIPEGDMRSGCALVNMGAETTTVSFYKDNVLKHLVVIPLGGKNISKDIADLVKVDIEEAERLKIREGLAYSEPKEEQDKRNISISNDRLLEESHLQDIISARVEEIIQNVWHQIENQRENMVAGITLTGGAACLRMMPEAFAAHTEYKKVKLAQCLMSTVASEAGVGANDDITLNTAIALLQAGDQNCAVEPSSDEEFNVYSDPSDSYESGDTTTYEPEEEVADEEQPKKKEGGLFSSLKKAIIKMVEVDDEE